MRVRAIFRYGSDVLVNIGLPFAIYSLMAPRFGDVKALLASSAPPILWSIIEFARHRRVDALSLLVLSGIGLSLLAFIGSGSVKVLQLREKLVTIIIGVVFLGSAAIGRPLMYELIRAFLARGNDPDLARVESLRDNNDFRRTMTIMTVVWGIGLLADAAISIALVYVLAIKTYLVVNPILGNLTIGSLTLWNIWYGARVRRRRRAAAGSAAPADMRVQAQR
jgi:hypothetical protein